MNTDGILKRFVVRPGGRVRLRSRDAAWAGTPEMKRLSRGAIEDKSRALLEANRRELAEAQEALWASDTWSVLIVLQGMDAAGKDGLIKHVMSGVNPQGCGVVSFKKPSEEELDHPFLWRCMKQTPERGKIVIFNRSHYEEVLVVRVNPGLLDRARLPDTHRGKGLWRERFEDINAFERHLARNGTLILKFMLHMSREEQKKRLLARLDDPQKHWKFNVGDLDERARWDDYQAAFEEMLGATSTDWAPWYVIPADNKWVARALIGAIITNAIRGLGLNRPAVSAVQRRALQAARRRLESE